MKETYKVKAPKHITIGDPWYFGKFTGAELERLTVDKDIPAHLTDARVVLEEYPCDEMPDLMLLDMTIYIAPKPTINTYLENQMYAAQEATEKVIGVDTAKYFLSVDGNSDTIHTGADGMWGSYSELKHIMSSNKLFDAIIIQLGFSSDFDSMESLREKLNYFFADVEQTENANIQDEDQSNDEGINMGGM